MNSFRTSLLAGAALFVLSVSSIPVSAQTYVSIRVGSPPPPVIYEQRPPQPYRTSIWVGGHHEWIGGRWVWAHGYWIRPPYQHPGAVWIPAHYHHGYWDQGHWRY